MADIESAAQPRPDENEKHALGLGESGLKGNQANKDHSRGREPVQNDAFLITFSPGDHENPLNWSKKMKWAVTASLSGMGFVRIMVSTVCVVLVFIVTQWIALSPVLSARATANHVYLR